MKLSFSKCLIELTKTSQLVFELLSKDASKEEIVRKAT
jgi:hypothetical protein